MNDFVNEAASRRTSGHSYSVNDRLLRHRLTDRLLHFAIAIAMITLLCSSLLPILGVKFEWVMIHWITGLWLSLMVLAHCLRVLVQHRLCYMKISQRELTQQLKTIHQDLTSTGIHAFKAGKYSPAQQAYHHAIAILVLTAMATGLVMLVKIDSPFWDRDPYFLSQQIWGYIYIFHGFSALGSISLIMIHIYFALRPEKLFYTRSMILGWITRDEHNNYHDPALWLPGIFTARNKKAK